MKMVRVILGSKSDREHANKVLKLFQLVGVSYGVSVASCHRNTLELAAFAKSIKERFVLLIGGHSFAAPGVLQGIFIGLDWMDKIVVAIPLDVAARSAIEDLPPGVPILTCGLNTIEVNASITNSGLAVARIVGGKSVRQKLMKWHRTNRENKPLEPEVELDKDGLIPVSELKK